MYFKNMSMPIFMHPISVSNIDLFSTLHCECSSLIWRGESWTINLKTFDTPVLTMLWNLNFTSLTSDDGNLIQKINNFKKRIRRRKKCFFTLYYILWGWHIIRVGHHKYFPGHKTNGVSRIFKWMVKLSVCPILPTYYLDLLYHDIILIFIIE